MNVNVINVIMMNANVRHAKLYTLLLSYNLSILKFDKNKIIQCTCTIL